MIYTGTAALRVLKRRPVLVAPSRDGCARPSLVLPASPRSSPRVTRRRPIRRWRCCRRRAPHPAVPGHRLLPCRRVRRAARARLRDRKVPRGQPRRRAPHPAVPGHRPLHKCHSSRGSTERDRVYSACPQNRMPSLFLNEVG